MSTALEHAGQERRDARREERSDPEVSARTPLSRQRVLEAALRYTDRYGLDGLSMRKLAAQLGVEAMSLYNHVDNKDDLFDGIVELLWIEIEAEGSGSGNDWRDALRELAHGIRDVVHRHPCAALLITSRTLMPEPALRLFDAHLRALNAGGFDQHRVAEAVRAVFAYAFGYAMTEVTMPATRQDVDQSEIARLHRITRSLPRDLPEHLVDVALAVCDCDMDAEFRRGVDLLLRGLDADARTSDPDAHYVHR